MHEPYGLCAPQELNYALDGLVGFDMYGKTVGIMGTGLIGQCAAKIFAGFGCKVIGYDPYQNDGFKAIAEATEILKSSTAGAATRTYSFVQVSLRSRVDLAFVSKHGSL